MELIHEAMRVWPADFAYTTVHIYKLRAGERVVVASDKLKVFPMALAFGFLYWSWHAFGVKRGLSSKTFPT